MSAQDHKISITSLVGSIRQIHHELAAQAGRAVNISLTLRNWLIGFYIGEYELYGADRASYGDRLLVNLSAELEKRKWVGVGNASYITYIPHIARCELNNFRFRKTIINQPVNYS